MTQNNQQGLIVTLNGYDERPVEIFNMASVMNIEPTTKRDANNDYDIAAVIVRFTSIQNTSSVACYYRIMPYTIHEVSEAIKRAATDRNAGYQ